MPLRREALGIDHPGVLRERLQAWLPLTYALNALNRSMGADDIYPFVLAPPAIDKLAFVDELVRAAGSGARQR